MPDAVVPVVRGRTHRGALPVVPEAHLCKSELGAARGEAKVLRQHREPRGVQPQECTHAPIQDDIIKYREGLESNIHDQLAECKQEIYVRIEQIFQKY